MATAAFINIYDNEEEALSVKTSVRVQFHTCDGIQLLPFNSKPYVQVSCSATGVNIEDARIYAIILGRNEEYDITNSFFIKNVFNDDNGLPQIEWHLANIEKDFGSKLVYLRMEQFSGQTYYTNPFLITELDKDKTVRMDYRAKSNDPLQSIQIKMYFWQFLKKQEIGTYYEQSTKQTQVITVKSQKYQRWTTDFMNNDLWMKITDVFENKFVYLNLTRTKLFEAPEVKEFEAEEDFKENTIYLSQFPETIDIDDIDPVIVPILPQIELNSVSFSRGRAEYDFRLSNYPFRSISLEVSSDQNIWFNNDVATTSPQSQLFDEPGRWYFRINHPEATSNVLSYDLGFQNPILELDAIDLSVIGFAKYIFFKDQIPDATLNYEYSSNLINWTSIEAASNNPTEVRFAETGRWHFRIRSEAAISNVISRELMPIPRPSHERFFISSPANTKEEACDLYNQSRTSFRFHDGENGFPEVGDSVYLDSDRTQQENRSEGFWYYTSYEVVLFISRDNVIEEVYECPPFVNPLVKVFRTGGGKFNEASACLVRETDISNRLYHDGEAETPVVGDRVYNDSNRENPAVRVFSLSYYTSYGFAITIDTQGYITSINDCSSSNEGKRFVVSTLTLRTQVCRHRTFQWNNERYHNGANEEPVIGDTVYTDSTLTVTDQGRSGLYYYSPTYDRIIRIDENGVITDITNC